jgi:excisionase family DNA binding protein
MEIQKLLTPSEAADILRVKLSTLYKYSMAGRIPTTKIGGALRFRAEDLANYIESNTHEPIKQALAAANR